MKLMTFLSTVATFLSLPIAVLTQKSTTPASLSSLRGSAAATAATATATGAATREVTAAAASEARSLQFFPGECWEMAYYDDNNNESNDNYEFVQVGCVPEFLNYCVDSFCASSWDVAYSDGLGLGESFAFYNRGIPECPFQVLVCSAIQESLSNGGA